MLQRLLDLVRRQGCVDVRQLARDLGVSEAMVRQMLGELERLGYVRRPDVCYLGPCFRCPLVKRCQRLWYVIDSTVRARRREADV